MSFRVIKSSIVSILKTARDAGGIYAGKYSVIGFQKEIQSAEEVEGNNRTVQVYYDAGSFDGAPNNINKHDMTFKFDLTVGSSGKIDLSGLESATSDAQRATIISNAQEALSVADDSLDEFIEIVFQVLMAGDNIRLGVDEESTGVLANTRMVKNVQKNEPVPKGEYAIVSATLTMACESSEELISTTEVEATDIKTDFEIQDDDASKASLESDIS